MPVASLETSYKIAIDEGRMVYDQGQATVLQTLDEFKRVLEEDQGFLQKLLLGYTSLIGAKGDPIGHWPGLYIYGRVGRGKSMLMDLFYAKVTCLKKRRVHFHKFMLEIHERLHGLQAQALDDILPGLAATIAKETRLLCFDEFHVNNIADAMILGRLFEALFRQGVRIVLTSNWAPDDLYKDGLQRERFLPFIQMIKDHLRVLKLEGDQDHRYEQIKSLCSYFYPFTADKLKVFRDLFIQLSHAKVCEPLDLPLNGRRLYLGAIAEGVGYFSFTELCRKALGAEDYLAVAASLHTIFIESVPCFQADARDEALRFMTLIDALYEMKVKLFILADTSLETLMTEGPLLQVFQRTISRLHEMQGETYRHLPHLKEMLS